MPLPDSFQLDIDSNASTLICRVEIDKTNEPSGLTTTLYLSTHSITFKDHYHVPALLNIPTIKESIDVFDKKIKISNTSLKISNIPLEEFPGASGIDMEQRRRFINVLDSGTIINNKVRIYFQTQSASTSDESVLIFTGVVRGMTQNNDSISLDVEDMTDYNLSNKQIPSRKVGEGQLNPKYKGKPIPMVYGHVDAAPTVLDSDNAIKADFQPVELVTFLGDATQAESDYLSQSDDDMPVGNSTLYSSHNTFKLTGSWDDDKYNILSPLKVGSGGSIANIPIKTVEKFNDSNTVGSGSEYDMESIASYLTLDSGTPQWRETSVKGRIKFVSNSISRKGQLQGISFSSPSDISAHQRTHFGDSNPTYNTSGTDGYDTPDRFEDSAAKILTDNSYRFYDIDDPLMNGTELSHEGSWYHDPGWRNQNIYLLKIGIEPELSAAAISRKFRFAINEFVFPKLIGKPLQAQSETTVSYNKMFIAGTNDIGTSETERNFYQGSFGANAVDGFDWDIGGTNSTVVYNLHTDFSGADPNVDEQWTDTLCREFKYLFGFPNHEESEGDLYTGLQPFNANDYNKLILIKDSHTIDSSLNTQVPIPYVFVNCDTYDEGYIGLYFGIHYKKSAADWTASSPDGVRDFSVEIGGKMNEIEVRQTTIINEAKDKDFFINTMGRTDASGSMIQYPISIIADIFEKELSLSGDDDIDIESLNSHDISTINFAFSINEFTDPKSLIEDMIKSTISSSPSMSKEGKFKVSGIQAFYPYYTYYDSNAEDPNGQIDGNPDSMASVISESEIISYSFSQTSIDKVYTSYNVEYKYDYSSKAYPATTQEYMPTSDDDLWKPHLTETELKSYNYNDKDDNPLKFSTKYIRTDLTAMNAVKKLKRLYQNQHLIVKLTLPIKYIRLSVGDVIRFDKLINNMKAFGIDYTKLSMIGCNSEDLSHGQFLYPFFYVTSTQKNLSSIKIEAMQLFPMGDTDFTPLGGSYVTALEDYQYWEDNNLLDQSTVNCVADWTGTEACIEGCMDISALNYNPEATCQPEPSPPDYEDICIYEEIDDGIIEGCLDPDANNYNPNATIACPNCCDYEEDIDDDGGGITPPVQYCDCYLYDGTILENYTNHMCNTAQGFFTCDSNMGFCLLPDGELIIEYEDNCLDQDGTFYEGEFDPSWWEGEEGLGCTDPDAANYDPEATTDDGSCNYFGCTSGWNLDHFSFNSGTGICPGYRASFVFNSFGLPRTENAFAYIVENPYPPDSDAGIDWYFDWYNDNYHNFFWIQEPWQVEADMEECILFANQQSAYWGGTWWNEFYDHWVTSPYFDAVDAVGLNDNGGGMNRLFHMSYFKKLAGSDIGFGSESAISSWEELLPESFPDLVQTQYQKDYIALTIGWVKGDFFSSQQFWNHSLWDDRLDFPATRWLIHLKNTSEIGQAFNLEWVAHKRYDQGDQIGEPTNLAEDFPPAGYQDDWGEFAQNSWGNRLTIRPNRRWSLVCNPGGWDSGIYDPYWCMNQTSSNAYYPPQQAPWSFNEDIVYIINRTSHGIGYNPNNNLALTYPGRVSIQSGTGRMSNMPSPPASSGEGLSDEINELSELARSISNEESTDINKLRDKAINILRKSDD